MQKKSSQIVVNENLMPELLQAYHDKQGHPGVSKSLKIMSDRLFYPGMSIFIKNYVLTCRSCVERKTLPIKNKDKMLHRESSGFLVDIISMDHLVIDQKSGKFSMLVIIDEFSKFAVLVPVNSLRAKTTVNNIVNKVFMKYGMPNTY